VSRGVASPAWIAPAILLLALLGLPVILLLVRAVTGPGLGAGLDPGVGQALVLSAETTALSLALVVLLGTPLAWLLARGRVPARPLVEALIDLPIVLPPAVAGLALLLLLGRRGPLGEPLAAIGLELPFSTAAVVIAQVFVSAPFFVRAARAGFAGVPGELEDAARVDGATEAAVARHVTFPLAAASLGAGAITAWARALGEFGATIMFAGNIVSRTQTLPLFVYSEFQVSLDAAIAAAAIMVIAAIAVIVGVRLVQWRSPADLHSLG
jgi:molybdate transport system permease protein